MSGFFLSCQRSRRVWEGLAAGVVSTNLLSGGLGWTTRPKNEFYTCLETFVYVFLFFADPKISAESVVRSYGRAFIYRTSMERKLEKVKNRKPLFVGPGMCEVR